MSSTTVEQVQTQEGPRKLTLAFDNDIHQGVSEISNGLYLYHYLMTF